MQSHVMAIMIGPTTTSKMQKFIKF